MSDGTAPFPTRCLILCTLCKRQPTERHVTDRHGNTHHACGDCAWCIENLTGMFDSLANLAQVEKGVLERANWECESCGEALVVRLSGASFADLDEREQWIVLCRDCRREVL